MRAVLLDYFPLLADDEIDEPIDSRGFRPEAVTAVTWECHPRPAVREAELHAEYESASRSVLATYGRLHGNRVRTSG